MCLETPQASIRYNVWDWWTCWMCSLCLYRVIEPQSERYNAVPRSRSINADVTGSVKWEESLLIGCWSKSIEGDRREGCSLSLSLSFFFFFFLFFFASNCSPCSPWSSYKRWLTCKCLAHRLSLASSFVTIVLGARPCRRKQYPSQSYSVAINFNVQRSFSDWGWELIECLFFFLFVILPL